MEGSASEYPYCDQGGHVPFARGGPIYVPDLVSPITTVSDFKFSLLRELQSLEAELTTTVDFDGELSVDELRVFSEEELVATALREGFEDALDNASASKSMELVNGEALVHSSVSGKEIVCSGNATIENNLGSPASLSTSAMVNASNGSGKKMKQKRSKKRGRVFDRHSRAAELEGWLGSRLVELQRGWQL